jgi:hypothetical protein
MSEDVVFLAWRAGEFGKIGLDKVWFVLQLGDKEISLKVKFPVDLMFSVRIVR